MSKVLKWYISNTGYVLQLAMPYYEELTVRENLQLASEMRLPGTFSYSQKFERVDQVMSVVSSKTEERWGLEFIEEVLIVARS